MIVEYRFLKQRLGCTICSRRVGDVLGRESKVGGAGGGSHLPHPHIVGLPAPLSIVISFSQPLAPLSFGHVMVLK